MKSADFDPSKAGTRTDNALPLAAVGLCVALQSWLIFALEINWDEFFYLSQIYDYQRGEQWRPLQSLHIHLLGWITHLPRNEVDQVIVGRFVMLTCLTGTCALIYKLARAFFSRAASAISVLAYVSAGPTIIHGASFRADPISAAIILLSLVVVARGNLTRGPMLAAGVAAAIASMITIKVVLYAPAFAGVAAWRLCTAQDRPQLLKWLAGIAISWALAFALLYGAQLAILPEATNAHSQAILSNSARTTIFDTGLLPRRIEMLRAAWLSPVQVILLVAGAVGVPVALVRTRGSDRCRLLAVAGCGATLLCLLFYRNAFPYFFPFIIPPAMLLVAWAAEWSSLLKGRIGIALLTIAMLVPAILVAQAWSGRERPPQKEVVSAVHEIFPRPVPMIDHSHMIGSFPKRGFFMSTWGMANYRANPPIFAGILQREPIPLLLLDSPRLEEALGVRSAMPPLQRLHDEDRAILRENFIPHWGPIWVAGKRIEPVESSGQFEILIPGTYTLEGGGLTIDGKQLDEGNVVQLDKGRHSFEARSPTSRILRWGNHLRMPAGPQPTGALFIGF